jgi:hypothetical protein
LVARQKLNFDESSPKFRQVLTKFGKFTEFVLQFGQPKRDKR